jgi:hypothetical protein
MAISDDSEVRLWVEIVAEDANSPDDPAARRVEAAINDALGELGHLGTTGVSDGVRELDVYLNQPAAWEVGWTALRTILERFQLLDRATVILYADDDARTLWEGPDTGPADLYT